MAFGGASNINGDPNGSGSHGTSARTAGVAAGVDYKLSPDTMLGFALAGGGTGWGLSQGLGGGNSDAFQAGLYGSQRFGPWYVSAAGSFANLPRFRLLGDPAPLARAVDRDGTSRRHAER